MNYTKKMLKKAISDLCVMRCKNMRYIYEGIDNSQLEKDITKQEEYVNQLIDYPN